MPYMKFLFVRPDVCRRLPSDSTSRWTPLPWGYVIPAIRAHSGLTPVRQCSCRAYIKRPSSYHRGRPLTLHLLCCVLSLATRRWGLTLALITRNGSSMDCTQSRVTSASSTGQPCQQKALHRKHRANCTRRASDGCLIIWYARHEHCLTGVSP